MPNIRLAKKSAAQKACVALHQCGELSDNMLPINKKKCLDLVKSTYFSHWESDAFKDGKFFVRNTSTSQNFIARSIDFRQTIFGRNHEKLSPS